MSRPGAWALGLALLAGTAAAQTPVVPNFVFTYRNPLLPTPVSVQNNGLISFGNVRLGTTAGVTFIVSNRATVAWTITEVTVSGPPFTLTSGSPGDIGAGDDKLFTLSFRPTSRLPVDGALSLKAVLNERTFSFTFFLNGTGLAPDLVLSYVLASEGNQVIVGDNDTITFPSTEVGQTASGTFVITNRGNGPGTVSRISLAGTDLRLSGVPLLPATVPAGQDVRFSFLFTPLTQDRVNGSLRLEFGEGDPPKTILLAGQGKGPTWAYEFLTETGSTAVSSNGAYTMASTTVGNTATVTVRVRNTGNGEGRLTTIAVTGPGFQVANLPFLPAALLPGQLVTFNLTFTPVQAGPAEGRLRVDNAVISLSATGLGSTLTFSVRQGATLSPLPANGTVTFPNTTVGTRASTSIQISNGGNTVARVASIALTGDVYTLDNLPALPVALSPGQAVEFTVHYSPAALGAANGALQIDGQRINLAGVGVPPPPLPAVAFTGVSGTVEPGQQPSTGLTIATPYPLEITGRLTLSFTSDAFADDPAIQFATGGRTINFTIPANTTTAVFGRDVTEVQFQTGTVAGTIALGATFTTGAVDLTPLPAPTRSLAVPAATPRLRGVQIGNRSASQFEVVVTGFSTLRSVTDMNLEFVAAPGTNLQTTSLSINVDVPFSTWYRGAGSGQFGSQFNAIIVIQVSGDINAVQSVTVTASNARGASAPVSANLR